MMTTTTLPAFGEAESLPEYSYPGTPERQELLNGKGYFVVRGVLDAEDISAIKDRLRMICENIDYYRQHIGIIREVKDEELRNHPDALYRFDWITRSASATGCCGSTPPRIRA